MIDQSSKNTPKNSGRASHNSQQSLSAPHYVRDYTALVEKELTLHEIDEAMERSVGGDFEAIGVLQRDLLLQLGFREHSTLVDVGCGSGRLAFALRKMQVGYLGIDIIPQLLEYARRRCGRADWLFERSIDLRIPAPALYADMVCFFSVFTHLKHEESFLYLREAARVLKPDGRIVVSFLEFSQPNHWAVFENMVLNVGGKPAPLDQFIGRDAWPIWARKMGLDVERIVDGSSNELKLSRDTMLSSGQLPAGTNLVGQSVAVLRK